MAGGPGLAWADDRQADRPGSRQHARPRAGQRVQPGDTPPIEASTSGNTFREPDLPSSGTNKLVYIGILAVVLVAILTFIGYAVGIGG